MTVSATVRDGNLLVEVTGRKDQFMCFNKGLTIPLREIVSARHEQWSEVRAALGARTLGGYIPKLVATGWYGVRNHAGQRQFLAVFRDRSQLIAIETSDPRHARVVLAVPNAARLITELGF